MTATEARSTSHLGPHDLGRQGFGAMRLREEPSSDPDRDPLAVVGTALDAGITMVDTADAYGNEELVGRALRGRRDEVILASKFGLVWREAVAGGFGVRADPAYVRAACEASLLRLGVERIDLYYLHHRSEEVPIEETVGAMAGLVTEGKIRAMGLSNVSAEDLRRAYAVHPVAALQETWSLVRREIEERLLPTAIDLRITIVAHSPTGHGLLHRPGREPHQDLAAERLPGTLVEIAKAHGATEGQVALAWVHDRQRVHATPVVPLPGTTSVGHLRENVAAADLRLSEGDLRQLDAASTPARRS